MLVFFFFFAFFSFFLNVGFSLRMVITDVKYISLVFPSHCRVYSGVVILVSVWSLNVLAMGNSN